MMPTTNSSSTPTGMPTQRNIFERIRNRASPLAAVADSVVVFRYGVSAPDPPSAFRLTARRRQVAEKEALLLKRNSRTEDL